MTPASTLPTFKVFPGDRGPPIVRVYNRAWAGALRLHHGPRHHHPSLSSATLKSQRLDMAGPSQAEGFTLNTALQPQQPGLF